MDRWLAFAWPEPHDGGSVYMCATCETFDAALAALQSARGYAADLLDLETGRLLVYARVEDGRWVLKEEETWSEGAFLEWT